MRKYTISLSDEEKGDRMKSKLTSRKFWLAIIGAIYTGVALLGYDVPIDKVIIVDAILAFYILAEAIVDAVRS